MICPNTLAYLGQFVSNEENQLTNEPNKLHHITLSWKGLSGTITI
jgi:hypothetical protein